MHLVTIAWTIVESSMLSAWCCRQVKYRTNYWRPQTAVKQGWSGKIAYVETAQLAAVGCFCYM
jgi:hypothetical protein